MQAADTVRVVYSHRPTDFLFLCPMSSSTSSESPLPPTTSRALRIPKRSTGDHQGGGQIGRRRKSSDTASIRGRWRGGGTNYGAGRHGKSRSLGEGRSKKQEAKPRCGLNEDMLETGMESKCSVSQREGPNRASGQAGGSLSVHTHTHTLAQTLHAPLHPDMCTCRLPIACVLAPFALVDCTSMIEDQMLIWDLQADMHTP